RVGLLGFALGVALAVTAARKRLRSPWLWAGGGLAALLVAPQAVWELGNGAPTLDFMRNAPQLKNYPVSPLEFLGGQLVLMQPLFAPLWVIGLGALLFAPRFAAVRALGVAYVALLALMILQKAKVYYLAPVYPVLFAAGRPAGGAFPAGGDRRVPRGCGERGRAARDPDAAPRALPRLFGGARRERAPDGARG